MLLICSLAVTDHVTFRWKCIHFFFNERWHSNVIVKCLKCLICFCTFTEGSKSFKMMEVLKFALRVLDCNSIAFADVGKMVYNVILCKLIFYVQMLSWLLCHIWIQYFYLTILFIFIAGHQNICIWFINQNINLCQFIYLGFPLVYWMCGKQLGSLGYSIKHLLDANYHKVIVISFFLDSSCVLA